MRERQGERGKALERAGCSEFLRNINIELAAQKQGAEEREERGWKGNSRMFTGNIINGVCVRESGNSVHPQYTSRLILLK